MLEVISNLPEDVTIEEAIERLVFLHKIQIGLQESGGKTQEEMKKHFQQRRKQR